MSPRYADPVLMQIEKHSIPEPNTGCWIWIHTMKGRYGNAWMNKRGRNAHAAHWAVLYGEPSKGKMVLHKCRLRVCVNPAHLKLGDASENMADAWAKAERTT